MDRKPLTAILLSMCAVLVIGCVIHTMDKDSSKEYSRQIFAMDTVMSFTAYGKRSEEAVDEAVSRVLKLDAMLSAGSPQSEVSVINTLGMGYISGETADILTEALDIYEETGGLFDITIYPLMELWGFPTGVYHVPDEDEIRECLSLVGSSRLTLDDGFVTLDEGQKIDLGGIAKGYTSGMVMDIFRDYGIRSAMVSLGGNIQALGRKPDKSLWRIGIRSPEKESFSILAVLTVEDRAVITSGGYERYFEEDGETYIHILDPRTGYPASAGLASVTIVSEQGMLADALSTSLYIMGAGEAESFWRKHADEFDMMLVTDDGSIIITEGIEDSINSDQVLTVLH